jgi:hypothetical protein
MATMRECGGKAARRRRRLLTGEQDAGDGWVGIVSECGEFSELIHHCLAVHSQLERARGWGGEGKEQQAPSRPAAIPKRHGEQGAWNQVPMAVQAAHKVQSCAKLRRDGLSPAARPASMQMIQQINASFSAETLARRSACGRRRHCRISLGCHTSAWRAGRICKCKC